MAEERVSVLSALGVAGDRDILSQVMEFALSPEVHAQEALAILATSATSRTGHRFTWNFFVANFDKILDRYLGGLFLFARLVRCATENFSDEDSLREVADFFAANRAKLAGSESVVEQAEEHVRLNVAWRRYDMGNVQAFLD